MFVCCPPPFSVNLLSCALKRGTIVIYFAMRHEREMTPNLARNPPLLRNIRQYFVAHPPALGAAALRLPRELILVRRSRVTNPFLLPCPLPLRRK